MSDSHYFALRRLVIQRQGSASILPHGDFTQPFNSGAWEASQGAEGWVYDDQLKLATNDGTYGGTQFLHQGFPLNNASTSYRLLIEVVAHPSGQLNFGSLVIYFGPYSLYIDSTPQFLDLELVNVNGVDHFFFLVNGTCRIALRQVQIIPL